MCVPRALWRVVRHPRRIPQCCHKRLNQNLLQKSMGHIAFAGGADCAGLNSASDPRFPPLSSVALLSLLLLMSCTGAPSGESSLTEAERQKLDRPLSRIVTGDTTNVDDLAVGTDAEGQQIFPVFLRVTDPDAFSSEDLPVNSWSGSIATARLTADQIRQAARLEVVESIRLSGRAESHD